MIPRSPSLFQIEDATADQTTARGMPDSGELVGLRLIIQSSPRQHQQRPPLAVLRRSSFAKSSPASSASRCQHSLGGRPFVGLEFLKCCLCCCRKIDGDMDVFVYKGEQAFCSAECRCQHMAREERREIGILIRKRRDQFHRQRAAPGKTIGGSSDRHACRVEISSFC